MTTVTTPDRFLDPSYLASGNARQRAAHRVLEERGLFERLAPYRPVLAGTIPLAIDVADSDLDVLCEVHDFDRFAADIKDAFGNCAGFTLSAIEDRQSGQSITATFAYGGFTIEIFGQARPVVDQNAFRHMVVEARLLELGGAAFRQAIVTLRREGLKTEAAFARRLGLEGDPYAAVLALAASSGEKLRSLLDDTPQSHRG